MGGRGECCCYPKCYPPRGLGIYIVDSLVSRCDDMAIHHLRDSRRNLQTNRHHHLGRCLAFHLRELETHHKKDDHASGKGKESKSARPHVR